MELNLRTSYYEAVHWLHNNYILCNEIANIDPSIWDNMEFSTQYWTDADGNEYSDPYDYDGDESELEETNLDIYQYYLTDCSQDDVAYLQEHFSGIYFTHSDMLDLYVLCVTHYGTSWKGVSVETDLEMAAKRAEKDLY